MFPHFVSSDDIFRPSVRDTIERKLHFLLKKQACFVNLHGIIGSGRTFMLEKTVVTWATTNDIVTHWFKLEQCRQGSCKAIILTQEIFSQLIEGSKGAKNLDEVKNFIARDFPSDFILSDKIGKDIAQLTKNILTDISNNDKKMVLLIDDADLLPLKDLKWFQQYILEYLTLTPGLGVFITSQTPISPWRWQFRLRVSFEELSPLDLDAIHQLCNKQEKLTKLVNKYSGGHPATTIDLIKLAQSNWSTALNEMSLGKIEAHFREDFLRIVKDSIDANLTRVPKHLWEYFYLISIPLMFDPNLLRALFGYLEMPQVSEDFTDLAWDISATGLAEWKSPNGKYSGYYLNLNIRHRLLILLQSKEKRTTYLKVLDLLIERYRMRAEHEYDWSESIALYIYYIGMRAHFSEPSIPSLDAMLDALEDWLNRDDVALERKNIPVIKEALDALQPLKKDFDSTPTLFFRLNRLMVSN